MMSSASIAPKNKSSSSGKTKRSLTPYNLYYRFKRGRILQAYSSGNVDKESILNLIATIPGLELMSDSEVQKLHPKDVHVLSRDIIRDEMEDNLLPFEGKRRHRKTHGMMEFVEMSKAMCDQWKKVDQETKNIFQELADEGKTLHRKRIAEAKIEELEAAHESQHPEVCDTVYKIADSTTTNTSTQPDCALFSTNVSQPTSEMEEILKRALSPSTLLAEDVHVVTPSSSPSSAPRSKVILPFNMPPPMPPLGNPNTEAEESEVTSGYDETDLSSSEWNDEFSAFIDENVCLVDDDASVDEFDHEVCTRMTLTDLINMDESISHFTLQETDCLP